MHLGVHSGRCGIATTDQLPYVILVYVGGGGQFKLENPILKYSEIPGFIPLKIGRVELIPYPIRDPFLQLLLLMLSYLFSAFWFQR